MTPFFRYWLLPGRLRRLSTYGKVALAVLFVVITAGGCVALLRLKGNVNNGPLNYIGFILVLGLPACLSILSTIAGADLIAGERQKQTWETLLLSPMPAWRVVTMKAAARLGYCLILALPPTIWFVAVCYRAMQESPAFTNTDGTETSAAMMRTRMTIVFGWAVLQLIGHLLPGVTLGAAVSARCRKVSHSLLTCAFLLIVYGVLFWQMTGSTNYLGWTTSNPRPGLVIFRWPLFPYLSSDYANSRALLPQGWRTNLAADLIWILALPALFLVLAVTWSRLSRHTPSPRKLPAAG